MPRLRIFPTAATRNSAPSRYQIKFGSGPGCFTAATTISIIDFEIASAASGVNALKTRNTSPAATTFGAAFHTNFKTGGTFLSAAKRSRQTVFCEVAVAIRYRVSNSGAESTKELSLLQGIGKSGFSV